MPKYTITCPFCGHVGDESEQSFDVSLADECWCPVCGESFLMEEQPRIILRQHAADEEEE